VTVRVAASEAEGRVAAADPLRAPVEAWIDATLAAHGDERAQRLARLEHCLRLGRSGRRADDLAAARDEIVRALVAMPAKLAVLGLFARGDRCEPVAAGSRSLAAARAPEQPPALHALAPDELLARFGSDVLGAEGRLVDLGTGDGRSFVQLAMRSRARELVAIDIAWSYTLAAANSRAAAIDALPSRATYVVLGPGGGPTGVRCRYVPVTPEQFRFADRLAAVTLAAIGKRSADVVTMLYPMHVPQPLSDGTTGRAVVVQLATALELLGPGGTGLLVTEDTGAWRDVARSLLGQPRVAEVAIVEEALAPAHLRALGIEPYTLSAGELDLAIGKQFTAKAIPSEQAYAAVAPVSWGLAVLWRMIAAD
jgi:hypothetical protein